MWTDNLLRNYGCEANKIYKCKHFSRNFSTRKLHSKILKLLFLRNSQQATNCKQNNIPPLFAFLSLLQLKLNVSFSFSIQTFGILMESRQVIPLILFFSLLPLRTYAPPFSSKDGNWPMLQIGSSKQIICAIKGSGWNEWWLNVHCALHNIKWTYLQICICMDGRTVVLSWASLLFCHSFFSNFSVHQ